MMPAFLLPIIGVLVVVLVAFYGFTTQGYFIHLTLLVAPIFVFLINSPSAWFVLIVGLSQSKLVFPGLPQGLHVVHVLIAGFSALMLARNIIIKPRRAPLHFYEYCVIGFTAIILLTAATRGVGIRGLGAESWGGMAYIKLLITAAFLIAARQIVLKPRQIKVAVFMLLIFSTLPLLAQVVYTVSGGTIYHQYMFIEAYVGGVISSMLAASSGGMVRYHMAGALASSILLFGLILIPPQGVKKSLLAIVMVLAFILVGISGFRGQVLWLIGTLTVYAYLNAPPKQRQSRAMLIVASGFIALLICYPLIPFMPPAMQRALSWLPMAPIPWDIQYEASTSATTRVLVWEMAWRELPRYLIIGKGFAVNPGDLMALSVRSDWVLNAFLGHNYHSGPLSLLLDTGIFGFVFATGFMIGSAIEMFRRLELIQGPPLIKRAYIYFLAQHIYSVPAYFIIFGDVRESIPIMFINLSIMLALYNSSEKINAPPVAPIPADRLPIKPKAVARLSST